MPLAYLETDVMCCKDEILDAFSCPIGRISQVAWKAGGDTAGSIYEAYWPGEAPVFAFHFEQRSPSCMLLAASDSQLFFRFLDDNKFEKDVLSLASDLDAEGYQQEEFSGSFDLDSVVCPVPGWVDLRATECTVVEDSRAGNLVGLCVSVNFGTRIGVFAAPLPGAALSFNDACDSILSQARAAEKAGRLRFWERSYNDNEAKLSLESIDWFDWLRDAD